MGERGAEPLGFVPEDERTALEALFGDALALKPLHPSNKDLKYYSGTVLVTLRVDMGHGTTFVPVVIGKLRAPVYLTVRNTSVYGRRYLRLELTIPRQYATDVPPAKWTHYVLVRVLPLDGVPLTHAEAFLQRTIGALAVIGGDDSAQAAHPAGPDAFVSAENGKFDYDIDDDCMCMSLLAAAQESLRVCMLPGLCMGMGTHTAVVFQQHMLEFEWGYEDTAVVEGVNAGQVAPASTGTRGSDAGSDALTFGRGLTSMVPYSLGKLDNWRAQFSSDFPGHPIVIDGYVFGSAAAAYEAAKFRDGTYFNFATAWVGCVAVFALKLCPPVP